MKFSLDPSGIDIATALDGLRNVVTLVRWRYSAEQDGVTEGLSGVTFLGKPDPLDFMDIRDVTDDWLRSKVLQKIDVVGIEELLAGQVRRRLGQVPVLGVQLPPE